MTPVMKRVTWLDPCSPDATAVYNISDLAAVHRPLRVTTMGWVLKETPDGVTIANEDCGSGDYRGLTYIMRALIVEEVALPKVRAKRIAAKTPPNTESQSSAHQNQ
jgi:hypothetical protein